MAFNTGRRCRYGVRKNHTCVREQSMIRSMTGFGRGETENEKRRFTVELKAVNHRYFDVNVKMPKKLSFLESAVRAALKQKITRGKIDVFITCEDLCDTGTSLHYHEAIAAEYVRYYRQIAQTFGLEDDIRASTIGRSPEVFELNELQVSEEEIWEDLEKALSIAITNFVQVRENEGAALRDDLLAKLDHMDENVALVEKRYPQIIEAYTQRLKDKVAELLGDAQIDEARLAAELVLFSDKICTDEETVRLHSHIQSMKKTLKGGGEAGRKLDFIAQEMNREANTILSKANDLETSNIAIDLKTEIEKIREQIQNIE